MYFVDPDQNKKLNLYAIRNVLKILEVSTDLMKLIIKWLKIEKNKDSVPKMPSVTILKKIMCQSKNKRQKKISKLL